MKIRYYLVKLYIIIKKIISYKNLYRFENKEFIKLQIDRFYDHLGLDNSLTHTYYLLPMISNLNGISEKSKILIIGPCNSKEIDAFVSHGFKNFIAIDLVSIDSRIKIMDMHNLEFKNSSFDLVYSTNVIHCTRNPQTVAAEIYRVTKSGGYFVLGVTVNLPFNDAVYTTDYKNIKGIISFFPKKVTLLYEKLVEPNCEENPHGTNFIKLIARK